jgi:hypothetical protein
MLLIQTKYDKGLRQGETARRSRPIIAAACGLSICFAEIMIIWPAQSHSPAADERTAALH